MRVYSPERNAKISAALRGRPKSEEHRAKLSAARLGRKFGPHSVETRTKIGDSNRRRKGIKYSVERNLKSGASRLGKKRGKYNITEEGRTRLREAVVRRLRSQRKQSRIEALVQQVLDLLGVDYVAQYPVARYVADFYIPSRNLILECDGEYWHSLPKMKERDERHDSELQELGFRVARLSEKRIKQNATLAVEGVL